MNLRARLLSCALLLVVSVPGWSQEAPPPSEGDPAADSQASNKALSERLDEGIALIASGTKVTSTVRAGVAQLTGEVASPSRREEILALARSTPGIHYVHDRITLLVEPQAPVEKASPAAERSLQDEQIQARLVTILGHVDDIEVTDISVRSGVVRLQGKATSEDSRKQAMELAAKLEGVLYVDNELVVPREVGDRLDTAFTEGMQRVRSAVRSLPLFGVALLIVVLSWIFARLLSSWKFLFSMLEDAPLVQELAQQAVRAVIVILGIVAALGFMDLTAVVGAVVGTAGVAGLAIGFAFRDIAENYLASLILSLRRPFKQNDLVEINGKVGKVVRLTASVTVLMTLDGNHLAIPNADVFKSMVLNYTRNPLRRFDFEVGIGSEDDTKVALDRALEVLSGMEGVQVEPKPSAWVERLGDSNVVIKVVGWVEQSTHDFTKVKSSALVRIKRAFEERGLTMPEPIYQVVMRTQEDAKRERAEAAAKPALGASGEPHEDLSVDDTIDKQIEAERKEIEAKGEKNLLPPKEDEEQDSASAAESGKAKD